MTSKIGAQPHTRSRTAIVTCPDCGEKIVLQGAIHLGLGVRCENCEAELRVVNMTPVEVDGVSLQPEDEEAFLARW